MKNIWIKDPDMYQNQDHWFWIMIEDQGSTSRMNIKHEEQNKDKEL